jgi:hypothetical protein
VPADAPEGAVSCAVADWEPITKQTTKANRMSELSTFLRTPADAMNAGQSVVFSVERINTLLDSGPFGVAM